MTFSRYLTNESCAGWPLLSMKHVFVLDNANPGWVNRGRWRVHVKIAGNPYLDLPVRPIWPGFAINTLLYAGILWLLFAAPFALRRRWRIKRGLCPKCGYNLRGIPSTSDACPECGAPRIPPPAPARGETA